MNDHVHGDDSSPLCCCEYVNSKGERSHLMASLCDCDDLDDLCERWISRRPVSDEKYQAVGNVIADRLRIPWWGGSGARKVDLDFLLPLVILPAFLFLSAQSLLCTVVAFVSMPVLIVLLNLKFLRHMGRSRFFISFSLTTVAILIGVFQTQVVPFLEILVLENLAVMLMTAGMLACFRNVWFNTGIVQPAPVTHVVATASSAGSPSSNMVALDIDDTAPVLHTPYAVCSYCKAVKLPRTSHCRLCNACIVKRDHHCVWLDCCIGGRNRKWFLLGVVLMTAATTYGSNLTLTTICQPVSIAWDVILMPSDCSDVYSSSFTGLCFASALYSMVLSFFGLCTLIHQGLLISLNLTGQEWRRRRQERLRGCYQLTESGHRKCCFQNWIDFFRE